jgi:uncharacterized protein (TIGR03435 family)
MGFAALPVMAGFLGVPYAVAQATAVRPEFEVASIKLNKGCTGPALSIGSSPGRLIMPCVTLRALVRRAYGTYEGLSYKSRPIQVLGGPAWADADRYEISAKAGGGAHIAEMEGPMLQALLEERFQLKVHKEARDTPIYSLTVAKSGPKFQALKEGGCVPFDTDHALDIQALVKPRDTKYCGTMSSAMRENTPILVEDWYGVTMAEYAGRMLSTHVGRPVVDKTEITGRFDIHLEFVRDSVPSEMMILNGVPVPKPPTSSDDAAGPSIFTALQEQLGLKLTPDRGPIDVLVIHPRISKRT